MSVMVSHKELVTYPLKSLLTLCQSDRCFSASRSESGTKGSSLESYVSVNENINIMLF